MTRYEIFLFLHVSAAIIWIGSGFLLDVQGARAEMVLKPTTDDAGTLVVMAATFVAGVAYVVLKARSVGIKEQVA